MHISPQPHVIGQVPAIVIRIVVDDHIVRVPEPSVAKSNVIGCNAEIEPTEPEASRSAARQPPMMAGPKAARESPMLPGTIQVIMRIASARIVAHPAVMI